MYLTGCSVVCIVWESFGNRPLMTNIETAADAAFHLYKGLAKLGDKEDLKNNDHPVNSVEWHKQNARREAFHQATMLALNCFIDEC